MKMNLIRTALAAVFGLASMQTGRAALVVTNSSHVSLFDATTGAATNFNFINGLSSPSGLALSGNNLYVANSTRVSLFDATTGAATNFDFITGLSSPNSLVVPEPSVFVLGLLCLFVSLAQRPRGRRCGKS